eukprot:4823429-Heterocapsa_arctica.AAC.1
MSEEYEEYGHLLEQRPTSSVSGLPSGVMALDDSESRVPTMCGITSATVGCVGERARGVHPVRELPSPQGEVDARIIGPSSEPKK